MNRKKNPSFSLESVTENFDFENSKLDNETRDKIVCLSALEFLYKKSTGDKREYCEFHVQSDEYEQLLSRIIKKSQNAIKVVHFGEKSGGTFQVTKRLVNEIALCVWKYIEL